MMIHCNEQAPLTEKILNGLESMKRHQHGSLLRCSGFSGDVFIFILHLRGIRDFIDWFCAGQSKL